MSAPKAGSRARARDERGGEATERIGWGGCGELVSGYRGSSRSHYQHRTRTGEGVANWCPGTVGRLGHPTTNYVRERIGPGGRSPTGVRMSRSRLDHTPPNYVRERIGWGGCGEVVSGGRAVVVFTRPPYTYESDSARDDVAQLMPGGRAVVSVTPWPASSHLRQARPTCCCSSCGSGPTFFSTRQHRLRTCPRSSKTPSSTTGCPR